MDKDGWALDYYYNRIATEFIWSYKIHETGYISYLFEVGSFDEKRSNRIRTIHNPHTYTHTCRDHHHPKIYCTNTFSLLLTLRDSDECRLPGVFIGKMISCDDKKCTTTTAISSCWMCAFWNVLRDIECNSF